MAPQAIHRQEKEQFIKLFEKDRIDRFEDRLAVMEVFLHTEHHVTFQELSTLVRQHGYDLPDPFIRETIELMCRYGFAQANHFDNGEAARYEHRHLGQHHDHLICTKCHAIIEFENHAIERLQLEIADTYGFHLLQHRMELYGICRNCMDQREILWLDACRPGERLKIVDFRGGVQARLRLLTLGLRVGDEVEIITNSHHGQLVVALDYNRLVLGQGVAKKIRVTPIASVSGPEKKMRKDKLE